MRILNGVLCALMLLFMAVQYNDPDGPFWAMVYGVGAIWAGLVCFRPGLFNSIATRGLLLLSLAFAAAGTAWFWPKTSGWWRQDVWWTVETAREGMGMMVLLVVLTVVLISTIRLRRTKVA